MLRRFLDILSSAALLNFSRRFASLQSRTYNEGPNIKYSALTKRIKRKSIKALSLTCPRVCLVSSKIEHCRSSKKSSFFSSSATVKCCSCWGGCCGAWRLYRQPELSTAASVLHGWHVASSVLHGWRRRWYGPSSVFLAINFHRSGPRTSKEKRDTHLVREHSAVH